MTENENTISFGVLEAQLTVAAPEVPEAATPEVHKKVAVVTQPTAEKAAQIWEVASAISQANQRPALLNEVIAKIEADGLEIGHGTIGAQYTRWCTFYGVTKEMRKALRVNLDPKAGERSAKAAAKLAEKEAAKVAKVAEKAVAKDAKIAERAAQDAQALAAAEKAREAVSWNKLPDTVNLGTIG